MGKNILKPRESIIIKNLKDALEEIAVLPKD
jgi:hypothetical protein